MENFRAAQSFGLIHDSVKQNLKLVVRTFIFKGCFPVMRFFYVCLRACAQYGSMNEFTCSEHFVRIRR